MKINIWYSPKARSEGDEWFIYEVTHNQSIYYVEIYYGIWGKRINNFNSKLKLEEKLKSPIAKFTILNIQNQYYKDAISLWNEESSNKMPKLVIDGE